MAQLAMQESAEAFYSSMCALLEDILDRDFGVETRRATLPELLGFLVTSPREGRKAALVIADDVSLAERVYLYVHVAAHLILGHGERPFATLLELRRNAAGGSGRRSALEDEEHARADGLARALFWGGMLGQREPSAARLSHVLLGGRHPLLQVGLQIGVARRAFLFTLRIARAAYHRAGARRALGRRSLVRLVREIYCLTEVVSTAPALLPDRLPRIPYPLDRTA